jgi:hypothetical protein
MKSLLRVSLLSLAVPVIGCSAHPSANEATSKTSEAVNAIQGYDSPASIWSQYFCTSQEVCATGDFNGDGATDIIAFHHQPGDARVWIGLGAFGTNSFGSSSPWSDNFCESNETCAVGDVNGDGLSDIVAFNASESLAWVSLSNGNNGFSTPQSTSFPFACHDGGNNGGSVPGTCRVADVDGDHKADLVAFTQDASAPSVYFAQSTSTSLPSFRTAAQWSSSFCDRTQLCDVGDVNGDGKADLLAFSSTTASGGDSGAPDTTVWVSLSTGAGLIQAYAAGTVSCTYGEVCKVADTDSDGFADIVRFTHSSHPQVFVAFSNGSTFGTQAPEDSFFCQSFETCLVGTGRYPAIFAASGDHAPADQVDYVWGARPIPQLH